MSFNFVPLYSNTKEEREKHRERGQKKDSRFFQTNENEPSEDETFPVVDEIKDIMSSLDGFVFVIESSLSEEEGSLTS